MIPIDNEVTLLSLTDERVTLTVKTIDKTDTAIAFEHRWTTVDDRGVRKNSVVLRAHAGKVYAPFDGSLRVTRSEDPSLGDVVLSDPFDPQWRARPVAVAQAARGEYVDLTPVPWRFGSQQQAEDFFRALYDLFRVVDGQVWVETGEPVFVVEPRPTDAGALATVRLRPHRVDDHPLLTYPVTERDLAVGHAARLMGRAERDLSRSAVRPLAYVDPDLVTVPSHAWQVEAWRAAGATLAARGDHLAAEVHYGAIERLRAVPSIAHERSRSRA